MQSDQSNAEQTNIRPTKKQQELLNYIDGFIQEHGYSPSYREIMNGLKYNAVATVALHVGNLVKRGHLRKRSNSARSLELVNPSFGSGSQTNIRSNQINPSEEKWLVQQLENRCVMLESAGVVQSSEVDDVFILAGALRVLGLDGAAQSFAGRLSELRKRCNEQDDAVDSSKIS